MLEHVGTLVERGWLFTYAAAVYNLVRMRNLVEALISTHTVPPRAPSPKADFHGEGSITDGRRRLM